jgi:hypothetical protein
VLLDNPNHRNEFGLYAIKYNRINILCRVLKIYFWGGVDQLSEPGFLGFLGLAGFPGCHKSDKSFNPFKPSSEYGRCLRPGYPLIRLQALRARPVSASIPNAFV